MKDDDFLPRHTVPLPPNTRFHRPKEPPELVQISDPALQVMTDFKVVPPVTVTPDVSIDSALEGMKSARVRFLLVIDEKSAVIGVITADDIQGERPIRLMEGDRLQRDQISVAMIMTPQPDIKVLDMRSVVDAQVGHIVETLRLLDRQHVLVIESDRNTDRPRIRGLFSSSQINRQLGRIYGKDLLPAHSLADIVHQVA